MRTGHQRRMILSKRILPGVRNPGCLTNRYGAGLVPVTCGCIGEATPTSDFTVLYRAKVCPLALEPLFRITRRAF